MRKGQAAMEFLMTYGWAILVVLAAIGALAYFGVLSPDRFLPSKCTASPPFACTEFKVNDTVTIELQNSGGVDMSEVLVTMTCGSSAVASPADAPNDVAVPMMNGAETQFVFSDTDCGATAGQRFKGTYTIVYTQSGSDTSHTATGSIQARGE